MFIAGPGSGPADTVGEARREQPERGQVTSRAEQPPDGRDSRSVAQDQASSIGVMQCANHARGTLSHQRTGQGSHHTPTMKKDTVAPSKSENIQHE